MTDKLMMKYTQKIRFELSIKNENKKEIKRKYEITIGLHLQFVGNGGIRRLRRLCWF